MNGFLIDFFTCLLQVKSFLIHYWHYIALTMGGAVTAATAILQILSFKRNKDSEDRSLYIKFIDMMLVSQQKVFESIDKINEGDSKASSYLLSYLNLIECIARFFYSGKLPKITKNMLFDELLNNITLIFTDQRIYNFFIENGTHSDDFRYIKMFWEDNKERIK